MGDQSEYCSRSKLSGEGLGWLRKVMSQKNTFVWRCRQLTKVMDLGGLASARKLYDLEGSGVNSRDDTATDPADFSAGS